MDFQLLVNTGKVDKDLNFESAYIGRDHDFLKGRDGVWLHMISEGDRVHYGSGNILTLNAFNQSANYKRGKKD